MERVSTGCQCVENWLWKGLWTCRKAYKGADKSLAQPGRKQVTATEDFQFHISYL
jgi:hypothetical protein